jgi:hypothetical protein
VLAFSLRRGFPVSDDIITGTITAGAIEPDGVTAFGNTSLRGDASRATYVFDTSKGALSLGKLDGGLASDLITINRIGTFGTLSEFFLT